MTTSESGVRVVNQTRVREEPFGQHPRHSWWHPYELARRWILSASRRRIMRGPFQGMAYVERSVCSAYEPKLLGSYELELQPLVEALCRRNPPVVVNVGAGEGYYAVGIARRCPDVHVIAFETLVSGQILIRELIDANEVDPDRLDVRGECHPSDLVEVLDRHPGAFVLMDAEGAERALLDPTLVPGLINSEILVELHEFLCPGITLALKQRFSSTHQINLIHERARCLEDLPIRSRWLDRWLGEHLWEHRPGPMTWMRLRPTGSGQPCQLQTSLPSPPSRAEHSERRLVLTIAIGPEYQRIAEVTHPSLRAYAERIGADFKAIALPRVAQTTPHWEKFQIAELLETYDRILYLDTDILVRPDCEDLFALVPPEKMGLFNEAPFTDRSRELLIDCCRQYGVSLPGWDGKYYNSGVMVVSRAHQALFRKPEKEVFSFYEQTYLNMIIAQHAVPVFELEHRYNRMSCMDRVIGEHRSACPIVHYAGALSSVSVDHLLRVMCDDVARWAREGTRTRYEKHIYVSVTGGLGDQLSAEPAIRFMRQELYPDDEMIVATHWPRAFAHLTKLGVTVCEQGHAALRDDTPYYLTTTLPGPETLQWRIVSHLLCHTADYVSMALMHRTLPMSRRTPVFEVQPHDHSVLKTILGGVDPSRVVVVHPGRHWNSKTFPVAWWQSVIDALVLDGQSVAVIGKNDPLSVSGTRGTVDVSCGPGVLDLRDQLDLGELGALLQFAPVLVSNDSAPVHLAGCFDQHIVLIPSCKHPDHVLPYRHGSLAYKATAVYRRLVIDDVESRPTQAYETSAEMQNIDWSQYLPEPESVVDKVKELTWAIDPVR